MTLLSLLLVTKILITLGVVILPFLFFKTATLDRLAGFGTPNAAFYRLYGMAILALVVAYTGGLLQTFQGLYPGTIVAMGLVSNVGAATVMVLTGYARKQVPLALFFGLVGVGFILAALFPAAAMTEVF